MSPRSEDDVADARGLAGLARRQLLRAGPGANDEGELERLVLAQRRSVARARRQRVPIAAGGAAAAVLALAIAHGLMKPNAVVPASFETKGQTPDTSATTTVNRYLFADGTVVSLAKGASIEVVSADPPRPYVRVAQGDAEVKVVRRPNTWWTFAAGPFEIEVVGTAFNVHWNPATQDFFLDLHEGVVTLRGPLLNGSMRVVSGQKVSVSLGTGQVATNSTPGPVAAQSASPAPTPVPIAGSGAEPTPGGRPIGAPPMAGSASRPGGHAPGDAGLPLGAWRLLVGRGDFDEVLSEARAQPLARCFAACSAADLRALGDAARYSNQPSLAESAFLALRRRFPETVDGMAACFLLARTYEAEREWAKARLWYGRYLAQAPAGEFAVEAVAGRARVAELQ